MHVDHAIFSLQDGSSGKIFEMNEFLFNDKPFDIIREKSRDKASSETPTKPYLSEILSEVGKIRLEILRMQKRAQVQSKTEGGAKADDSLTLIGPEIAKAITYLEHVIREIRSFKPELLSIKNEFEDELIADYIKDMLPVADALNRVMATMEDVSADSKLKSWFLGIKQIYNTLMLFFKQHDVEEVPALGLMFDPKKHAAVAVVENPDHPNGTIVRVEKAGFIRKGFTIRYPEVVIVRNSDSI